MIRISIKVGLLCVAVVLGMSSVLFGQASNSNDFYGSVDGGVYRNPFLGFDMPVIDGWIRFDDNQIASSKKAGLELSKTDNSKNNEAMEKVSHQEVVVLTYSKKPLGSAENSIIALGVAKRSEDGASAKSVADDTRDLFLENPKNKLIRDTTEEVIAGKKFASIMLDLDAKGQTVHIKYYAVVVRGYSLSISMAYSDDDSLGKMEDSIRHIKFQ